MTTRLQVENGIEYSIDDNGRVVPTGRNVSQDSQPQGPSLASLAQSKLAPAVEAKGAQLAGAELGTEVSLPGIGAGAYTGYQQAKGVKAAVKGDKLSSTQEAALALPTFGGSYLVNPAKKLFGGKSTHQEEAARQKLIDAGVNVVNPGTKEWENNAKFAQSRQESDLTGKDIMHAASLYNLSPDYAKADAAKQEAIANEALKQGLIREEHGQIDLGSNDAFEQFYKNQLAGSSSTSNSSSKGKQQRQKSTADNKAQREQALLSELSKPTSTAPDYSVNLSSIYRNPYL